MKEIKFRAWNGKEMSQPQHLYSSFWHKREKEIKELMQYTGLKDKNGKEIYEGDIIRIESDLIGEIKWNETWNCLKLSHNESNGLFLNQEILGEIEILGNIFENPELLK